MLVHLKVPYYRAPPLNLTMTYENEIYNLTAHQILAWINFDFKLWFHLFKIIFKIFKTLGDNSWSFIIFGVKLKLVNELNFAWANLASNQRQYLSYMCLVYRLEHRNNRNANITNFVYFEKKTLLQWQQQSLFTNSAKTCFPIISMKYLTNSSMI